MQRLLSLVALMGIAAGTMALAGCESNNNANPSDTNGAMSGGNGAFGENPAHPGSYSGDRYSTPPTTRPASYE